MERFVCRIVLALLGTVQVVNGSYATDSFFHDQVVPIFQRRCVGCHNDSDSKGDFSVESSDLALSSGFIEPGDAEGSRLIEVITPADGRSEMPKDADPMTAKEIAVLREWIEKGANWPTHIAVSAAAVTDFDWWSWKPLHQPPIPAAATSALIRTPVDAFIQAKLLEKNLTPSPEASRQTLIRRLYFDLIGLPPAPNEVEKFVQNAADDAYEQLVDHLLDSEHYGERWARHWLDVVHYADTHGYDKDKLRPNAWPYRDYVIRSFNEDRPYSRFVQEQIAGDVLWPYTVDGITATGFIAAGPWDFIGHAEVPETKIDGRIARHLDRDDMVASTMNAFTSTTVQCARCHNHKFDAITQEHYYSLQAVFAALDRAERPYDQDPAVSQKRANLEGRRDDLVALEKEIEEEIRERGGERLASVDRRIEDLEQERQAAADRPEFGYHSQLSAQQDTTKWVQIDLGKPMSIGRVQFVGAHDTFHDIGAGFGFPLRYKIEASNDATFATNVTTITDCTSQDHENPGTEPRQIDVHDVAARYIRMTATKLALRKEQYFFALAELSVYSGDENVAKGKQVSSLDSIEQPARWSRDNIVDEIWHGKGGQQLIEKIEAAREERLSIVASVTADQFRVRWDETRNELESVEEAIEQLPTPGKVYAGTIHRGSGAFKGTGANGGKPRTIHVLHRGDILQPRQLVQPGRFPLRIDDEWQFQLDEDHSEGERRAALARWLVDRDNPLTWRSIVNRIWQYHFGRGIVDSPNDFGRMGSLPSHPELLDWLAVEFRDNGQSLKRLHKLLVLSSTYRQVSSHNDENAVIDSGNTFLWRMNRRRLSAEEVRDATLHVSGKLDRTMYGPGARLFVLERPEHSPHYEYHKHDPNDPSSHRRAIYRFIVRSQPDPFMTTLDCADSSQSVPKRDETVTPLQALALLNNKFMLSMSQHFAHRIQSAYETTEDRVDFAFQLATGHPPNLEQTEQLAEYAKEFGWANTCRLVLNLNEFVFVD